MCDSAQSEQVEIKVTFLVYTQLIRIVRIHHYYWLKIENNVNEKKNIYIYIYIDTCNLLHEE